MAMCAPQARAPTSQALPSPRETAATTTGPAKRCVALYGPIALRLIRPRSPVPPKTRGRSGAAAKTSRCQRPVPPRTTSEMARAARPTPRAP